MDQEDQMQTSDIVDVSISNISVDHGNRHMLTVHMDDYNDRIRQGSTEITIHLENSRSVRASLVSLSGKTATLDAECALNLEADRITSITLSRRDEVNHVSGYVRDLAHAMMDNASQFEQDHPLLHAILSDTPSSAYSDALHNNDQNTDAPPQLPSYLDEHQRNAAIEMEKSAITVIEGGAGTGKTRLIAALMRCLAERRGTSPNSHVDGGILCLASNNYAARNLTRSISKHLGARHVKLIVSPEFFVEWHEDEYQKLMARDYCVVPTVNDSSCFERPYILVCTIGCVFGLLQKARSQQRPWLDAKTMIVFEEASQVDLMAAAAVMFLYPTSLAKVVVVGDTKQLPPYSKARSVLAHCAQLTQNPTIGSKGTLKCARINLCTQHRMSVPLTQMISTVFYEGELRAADTTETQAQEEEEHEPPIDWYHIDGAVRVTHDKSVYNPAEAAFVAQFIHGMPEHTAVSVLTYYDAQKVEIMRHMEQSHTAVVHVYNVDSYQGRENDVVVVSLATHHPSAFMLDRRRLNVACSRARKKLVFIGHRKILEAPVWKELVPFCRHC